MGAYWDKRAKEDAFYFVDSRLPYGDPDLERFWAGGVEDLDTILGTLGLEMVASDDVVEVGCGVGRLTRAISPRVSTVRALDVSGEMLEIARERNPELANVTWIHGDGSSLEAVESESADVCFSHVVFQHIPDPQITLAYIRDFGRVLRPGGWAGFQVSNSPEIHTRRSIPDRLRTLPSRLRNRAPRGQEADEWLGSAIDLDDLQSAAAGGGLEIARTEGAGTQYCLVLLRKPA